MSYKIMTKHPVGMRMFTDRAQAEKIALGFGIADETNVSRVIVKTGNVLVGPRQGD